MNPFVWREMIDTGYVSECDNCHQLFENSDMTETPSGWFCDECLAEINENTGEAPE